MIYLLTLSLLLVSSLRSTLCAPTCPLHDTSEIVLKPSDQNTYQLIFQWKNHDVPIDYVDYHYQINQQEVQNIRAYDGSTNALSSSHTITLQPNDVLHAMITYSSNGMGCDVKMDDFHPQSSATLSSNPSSSTSSVSSIQSITDACTNVQPQLVAHTQGIDIETTLPSTAEFVDAHYQVSGTPGINVRMVPSSSTPGLYALPNPIIADADSHITYYLTFGSSRGQCDTAHFEAGADTSSPPSSAPSAASSPAPASESDYEANIPNTSDAVIDPGCSISSILSHVARDAAGNFIVSFNSADGHPYDTVDLASLIGETESTQRIAENAASGSSAPLVAHPTEALNYYLIFAKDGIICNSEWMTTEN